jgi:hypothetical protein
LNRPADFGGETGWTRFIQQGGTAEQVMANFLSSPEYFDHATALSASPNPDANFIQTMYLQLLGRPGSGSEINGWLGKLPTLGRNGVAAALLASQEARTDQVLQFYVTLLHRTTRPGASELAFWLNTSLDLLGMEVQFAASQEFYSKG